ncbi:hypothetical protein GGI42DRAFT_355342 [Trichoderma sp. SZMC 28013]
MAMSPHLTSLRALNAVWPLYQRHLEAFPVPEIGKAQCNLHGLHTPGMQLLHARADEVRARLEATGRCNQTYIGRPPWLAQTKPAAVFSCLVRTWTCLIGHIEMEHLSLAHSNPRA